MKDVDKRIIYIGKAKNIKQRVKQYFIPGRDGRPMVPFLTEQIDTIDTLIVPTEREALLLENTLIKKHQPKFNAILKDDKTFISLMININHQWPMLKLVRYKKNPPNGLLFGPYTSAHAARQTFDLLTQIFPLRQCSDEELKRRTRPCILYSIKRCVAPCVNRCTKEEYDKLVTSTIQFLKGKDKEIIKTLTQEMERAAKELQFEKAAAYRNTLHQIEHVITSDQLIIQSTTKECDVLSIYRNGVEVVLTQLLFRENKLIGSEHFSFSLVAENDEELITSFLMQHYSQKEEKPREVILPISLPHINEVKDILSPIQFQIPKKGDKKALVELAEKNGAAYFKQKRDAHELKERMLLDLAESCHLLRYPKRIECFDTSHLSGTSPVACMVAFTEGEKDKKRTRLFHIKGVIKGDDYGALHQVLSRRLLKAKDEDDLPDLIIVDGGKGQLNIALQVLKELDIASVDAIGIAKQEGRHDKGMTEERLFLPHQNDPIHLPPRSPLLFLLQQIRDEAHQKAIAFHRKSRKKELISSAIDKIKGIGPIKRKRLLTHFGSVKRIKEASIQELLEIPGITQKDIQLLKNLKQMP